MSTRLSEAFSFILVIVSLPCAGCMQNPFMEQIRYEEAQWESKMAKWQQDWDKNRQDVNDCLAELKSILGQETSLLETLGHDEQIQPAGFQLYKDFLLYIQESGDQIKTYEFIEKMRAVLPADEMETIEKLDHQVKRNQSKYSILEKQKAVLQERLMELGKENDEWKRRGEEFILLHRI
jgi:wyosine [tRNA(Phe)-imidazoG37] synthetase (radical SAM superfamily)